MNLVHIIVDIIKTKRKSWRSSEVAVADPEGFRRFA